jgi:hypothetical protein
MKPGVVKTSNALELMRSIGLGVEEPNKGRPDNDAPTL